MESEPLSFNLHLTTLALCVPGRKKKKSLKYFLPTGELLNRNYMAQMVKNLPAMQEIRVRSLGREDSLEEGMATHSSILGLENPTDRGAWRATDHRVAKI